LVPTADVDFGSPDCASTEHGTGPMTPARKAHVGRWVFKETGSPPESWRQGLFKQNGSASLNGTKACQSQYIGQ
jgi:hypothetical protein